MTAVGTTSDLYVKDDQGNAIPMAPPPPSAPSDIPPPTKVAVVQPVVVKHRMADEGPDGRIRDTSTDALRPGNDLSFRTFDADPKTEEPTAEAAAPAPAKEKQPEPPPAEAPKEPEPPKLYAGKFKSVEELEKGYDESVKKMQQTLAERDQLKNKVTATEAHPVEVQKTPEQVAAEKQQSDKILADFVTDPKGFIDGQIQRAQQQTQVALAAQDITNRWRTENRDLADMKIELESGQTITGEFLVSAIGYNLSQADPTLAKDPIALINRATASFRQLTGKIRTEGAREALTQETRVIPLAGSSPSAAEGQTQNETPRSQDDYFAEHMKMLKSAENKSHRGLRR